MNTRHDGGDATFWDPRRRGEVHHWLLAHLHATWLRARWTTPLAGYLVAVGAQFAAAVLTLLLMQIFPLFAFPDALAFGAVAVIAATWGAGPSILATVVGLLLLDYVVLPPHFAWTTDRAGTAAALLLFLGAGCGVGAMVGRAARARRAAHAALETAEAALRAAEAARRSVVAARARELDAAIEVITDAVLIHDVTGGVVRVNAAGQRLLGLESAPPAQEAQHWTLGDLFAWEMRDGAGHYLLHNEWPAARVLRGEVLAGADAMPLVLRAADGRDQRVVVSGAPMRDSAGAIVRAVIVLRDVPAATV